MTELTVRANGATVGTLSVESGVWSFCYDETWQEWPLSPQLPLAEKHFVDRHENLQVEWFFDNFLPEGRVRRLIANRDRIAVQDTWAFLMRHGQDMAGALSLHQVDTFTDSPGGLLPLSPGELQEKIRDTHERHLPLMAAWDGMRMSLAGAQEKLGLLIRDDGSMFLPTGNSASTHIVKPENISPDFPFCPANEFFCMKLARELKLPVPEVTLLHLPEPVYAITRYDRVEISGSIRRLHQIDLCQAMGAPPSLKYESDGGLGLGDLLPALATPMIERPIMAINAALQWVVFNYLIGNLDAHAKNIAFMVSGQKMRLAPFYDLLCVEAYLPGQPMSMAIAGENKPGWIEWMQWDALAKEAGVAPRYLRTLLNAMQSALPKAAFRILEDNRLLSDEKRYIQEKVLPILEQRRGFIADSLKQNSSARTS